MIMVREVLYCNPGKVGELVKKFKALGEIMKELGYQPFRLFTDVCGERFWTLVLENEFEAIGDVQAMEAKVMADSRAQSVMAGYHDLVSSGRREIYKVEA